MQTSSVSRLQLWNAYFGNFFEHYDSALFGFLSPFLAPLIFPEHDALSALILTYAIFPLSMLARPIGSLVFGRIGDLYGRSYALFLTLAGMGIVSGCIAFSPTYLQVGILAPIFFCLGKTLQNFFAAGENMGGAIFLLENVSEKRHDLLSGVYAASSMGGHLLASLGIFLISYYHALDTGWRWLYLFGCITALFGCVMRRAAPIERSTVKFAQSFSGLKQAFCLYYKPFFCIAMGSGLAMASYSIALVLMNGFVPLISSISKEEMMKINTYLLLLDFCALPLFGWLASKIRREVMMLLASLGVVIFAIPLVSMLEGASLAVVIAVRMAFALLGVAFFAPFHAWVQQLVPKAYRYVIISSSYAIGAQVLGSPTAAIALWSFQKTGMVSSIVWYWICLAGVASIGLVLAWPKTVRFTDSQQNYEINDKL